MGQTHTRASRIDAYQGDHAETYQLGYDHGGRFGGVGMPEWSDAQRAAYRQGGEDRHADDRALRSA